MVRVILIRTDKVKGPKLGLGNSKNRLYHSPVRGSSISKIKKYRQSRTVVLILIDCLL